MIKPIPENFPSLSQITTKYLDWITPAWENKVCRDGSISPVASQSDKKIMGWKPRKKK